MFLKIIKIFEKMIGPLAQRLAITHVLGELTITVLAFLFILLGLLLLGMLMQLAFITAFRMKLASFYVLKGIIREDGEMLTIEKEQVCFYPVDLGDIRNAAKQFGKTIIALAEKINGAVPEKHKS